MFKCVCERERGGDVFAETTMQMLSLKSVHTLRDLQALRLYTDFQLWAFQIFLYILKHQGHLGPSRIFGYARGQ